MAIFIGTNFLAKWSRVGARDVLPETNWEAHIMRRERFAFTAAAKNKLEGGLRAPIANRTGEPWMSNHGFFERDVVPKPKPPENRAG